MANACNSVIVMNGHSNMNLKLWLTLKLDCSNFQEHGIEYISKEVGTFKIIWVKQSEPGWKILEQLLKVCDVVVVFCFFLSISEIVLYLVYN